MPGIASLFTFTKFHQVKVGQYSVETYCPDHWWSTNDPAVNSPPPQLELMGLLRGDVARVIDGPHCSLRGHIDWIANDLVWIAIPNNDDQPDDDFQSLGGETACVKVSNMVSTPVDIMINFTKEKGYDVSVADKVRVARGPYYGLQGIVKNVRFDGACLDLVCQGEEHLQVNIHYSSIPTLGNNICLFQVTIPIAWCVKLRDFSMHESSKLVGKEGRW